MQQNETYYSLHNHTDFSNIKFPDAIIRTEELIDHAFELGLKGVAITDHDTLSSHVKAIEYLQKKRKSDERWNDFKLILGNEIYLCRNGLNKTSYTKDTDRFYHFILLAKDEIGYKQIMELSARAWKRSYTYFHRRIPTYYSDIKEVIGQNPGHVVGATACFRKDTKVLTLEGEKNIQDITSKDFILNRFGQWEKVNFPTSRHYKGGGREILFTGRYVPTVCTENHKFLTITGNKKKPSWVEAKDLNTKAGSGKDICLFPIQKPPYNQKPVLNKKDWLHSFSRETSQKRRINLPEKITITPELMRLFGLFLGDGHITLKDNPRIGFTLNISEFESYYDSFIKKAGEQLNLTWSVSKREKNNRVDISSGVLDLVDLFFWLFGDVKANNKKVPERLKHISKEYDQELIFGYLLADGYFRTRMNAGKASGYETGEFVSASISQELTSDIQELLDSLLITGNVSLSKNKVDDLGVNHQNAFYLQGSSKALGRVKKGAQYSHHDVIEIFEQARKEKEKDFVTIDSTIYRKIRIKSIKEIELDEQVYCLNVDSHSFVCNRAVVHNCLGGFLSTALVKAAKYEHSDKDTYDDYIEFINEWLTGMSQVFGKENLLIELQPGLSKEQLIANPRLLDMAKNHGLTPIITTDSHYLKKEDKKLHAAFLNSKGGDRETEAFYEATFMMDSQEIHSRMDENIGSEEVSELLANTLAVGDMFKDYQLTRPLKLPYLPRKSFDEEILVEPYGQRDKYPSFYRHYESPHPEDRQLAIRLHNFITSNWSHQYDEKMERVEFELQIIEDSGKKQSVHWSRYFLQMADYCKIIWNRANSLIGAGRGSGGASYILYALDITQIDPTREKAPLLFTRFMNPDRASVLDVDIDVMSTKRNDCISEIQKEYGEDHVIRVATFRTEQSKSAVKTAARGLGIPVDDANFVSSLIGSERGLLYTLTDMVHGNPEKGLKPNRQFLKAIDKYENWLDVATRIEGLVNGIG